MKVNPKNLGPKCAKVGLLKSYRSVGDCWMQPSRREKGHSSSVLLPPALGSRMRSEQCIQLRHS